MKPLFTILLICLTYTNSPAQNRFQTYPEQEQFNAMAEYLTRGSGQWRGENPHFNPQNPRSPKAFGLWFERTMYNLLTIKVVAYRQDTTVISSQGIFAWNPQKKQYAHVTADRGGGFSEGVTEFTNDSTFTSIMKVYRPNGKVLDHKDENFVVNQNEHHNTSFNKDEQGNWVENSNWIWKREPLD